VPGVIPDLAGVTVDGSRSLEQEARCAGSQASEDVVLVLEGAFTSPLELSGRPYDEAAADAVFEVTGGYPFMIQFFGALLWDAIAWPARITKTAFDQYQTILDALDRAFFEARLARSSHAERSVLRAIALRESPLACKRC